jgi:hypothetical protein
MLPMPLSEGAQKKLRNLKPFEPGKSGNPNGRPKGSRNKLGEAFIEALHDDFADHGVQAIVKVREERPHEYLRVIAGILPKELKVTSETDLTDDQLIERIRQLDEVIRPFLDPEGEGETRRGAEAPEGYH